VTLVTLAVGFSFRVCSSALLPRTYVDNLDFLTDYFISQPVIPERLTTLVRERVQAEPGISIGILVGDIAGLRPHDRYLGRLELENHAHHDRANEQ
jgi:hypothetical protein